MTTLNAIPGTMCDQRLWQQLQSHLPTALSLNHVPIENGGNIRQMTDTVANTLTDTGYLLGFSLGGYIALNYAVEHPEKINKLVIVASSALGLSEQEQSKRQQMINVLSRQSAQYLGPSDKQLSTFIGKDAWQSPEIVNTIRAMDKDLGVELFLSQMKETTYRPTLLDKLVTIECPVLLIAAEQDQKVPLSDLEKMAVQFKQAELVTLSDCGHMIPLEKPKALARHLTQFLLGE